MNDWTTYRAECNECVFCNDGICLRTGKKKDEVCPSFELTEKAAAIRYVRAKRHGDKLGITYDATGHILQGMSHAARHIVQFYMKRGIEV